MRERGMTLQAIADKLNRDGVPTLRGGARRKLNDVLTPITRETTLHGHKVCYRAAGERGPLVVLIHGIAGTSETWGPVLPLLAERHTAIAPDLLGHGQSG